MLTHDDRDLERALASLREARPQLDARALVARASTRRRRSRRLVAAVAAATAAVALGLAALPGRDATDEPETAEGLLRAAAAVAAGQPEPPAWAGFRYVKELERWTLQRTTEPKPDRPPERTGKPWTIEKTVELWVDRRWRGRQVAGEGRVVAGKPASRSLMQPYDGPFQYGDGPLANVPLAELPTDPGRLHELLVASYKDLRWAPPGRWAKGHPTATQTHYDVLRHVLLLLSFANVTADQRAALIGVLGRYDEARPLPAVRDRLGRAGRGVEIPVTRRFDAALGEWDGVIRVIFSPDTGELLEWSESPAPATALRPGEAHTFVRTGHVAAIADRPR
jgi:hypothetical protein